MNDETRNDDDLVLGLQEEVERLEDELEVRDDRIEELETEVQDLRDDLAAATAVVDEAPAPTGDEQLQGLASTVKTALRTGHPDAQKHLDNLLNALGAQ